MPLSPKNAIRDVALRDTLTYLAQLLAEARWVARFDVGSCVAVLERTCPDYRGPHVNLCDLLMPHERELARA